MEVGRCHHAARFGNGDPMNTEPYNYYRAEIAQCLADHDYNESKGNGDWLRLRVTGSGDAQTKWMNISRSQLDRIADILEEGDN